MGRKEQKQQFKEALEAEVKKGDQSKYFIGGPGIPLAYQFDTAAMVSDYARTFPNLSKDRMARLVENAVIECYRH